MDPIEEANKEILWVLRVLKKTIEVEGYGKICVINVNFSDLMLEYPNSPSLTNIRHIVRNQLEKKHKVLEIVDTNNDKWYGSTRFILEIKEQKFEKLYKEYEPTELKGKVNLKKDHVKFLEDKSTIVVGDLECPLLPYKNEFYLCKVMFNQKVNTPISWDFIYKETTGDEGPKNEWRSVYDTMRKVNKRFMQKFNIDYKLFSWQNKTIKRNFGT